MTTTRLAFSAIFLSMSNIVRLLLQFLMLPILARMLDSAQFGLVAIAMPFIVFAQIFSEGGLGQTLVKENPDRRNVWSSIFWIVLGLGLSVTFLLMLIAPAIAFEYGQSDLRPLVTTLALLCAAQAATVVPMAALQRAERFSAIAFIEMTGAFCGAAAAYWFASHQFGAWALVAQQLVIAAVRLVLIWYKSGFIPSFGLNVAEIGSHMRAGRDIITFNVINFFARSFDPLVIGKLLGVAAVGSYIIAYQMMRLPSMLVTGPIQSVFYTRVVNKKSEREEIKTALLFASRLIAIAVFPMMGIIAAAHAPFFRLFLSSKWEYSGDLFMMFAAVGSMQAVTGLNGAVLLATGCTGIQIRFTTEFTVIWVICLLLSANVGVVWIPIAYSASWFLYFPRFSKLFLSTIGCSRIEYVSVMVVPAVATAIGILVYSTVVCRFFPNDEIRLISAFALIATLIALSLLLQVRLMQQELAALNHF